MSPIRRRVLLVLAVAGFVAMAAPVAAQDDFSLGLKRVHTIRFEGRHHVKPKELLSVMKTKKPSFLPWADRPVLRNDFLRNDTLAVGAVYRRHGFLDAHVEYQVDDADKQGLVDVTFRIHEGARSRVARVDIEGSTVYPVHQLRKRLVAKPGRTFDPTIIVADTSRISREYQDRGYIPRVVADVLRDGTRVYITYRIDTGPLYHFGDVYISVAGEQRVKESLIRRELQIVPDEVYRYSKVERSREQLTETGFFNLVQLGRIVDSTFARVEWDLRLSERKPRWIDAGIGSGTSERFRFTGEWGHRNLAGAGLQGVLDSRVAFDGNGRFLLTHSEVSVLEPWLFRTRTRGQITPYYERSVDRSNSNFRTNQERLGLTFRAHRVFGRFFRMELVQDNAFVRQSVHYDPNLSPADLDSLIEENKDVEPKYTTHRLQLVAERDRRDFPLNPERGSYQTATGEIAGGLLRGSSNFLKTDVTSSWYTPLPNGWILATRLRAGAIDPFGDPRRFTASAGTDPHVARVPLEDRFRLGGVNTVRGYTENHIPYNDGFYTGGLALLLGNVEMRVPVYGPFGLEFFVDAGNVWPRSTDISLHSLVPEISNTPLETGDLRYVYGVGGRLNLPFGPLRLDFAWNARPEENGDRAKGRYQFAIGPTF